MMLACLDRGSRTLTPVRAAGRFGVNALAAGQEELARRFATKDPEPEKWEGVEWSERRDHRALDDALIWVACELRDLIDGGDHLIVTGDVLEAEAREGEPLLFHRGDYRDLLDESSSELEGAWCRRPAAPGRRSTRQLTAMIPISRRTIARRDLALALLGQRREVELAELLLGGAGAGQLGEEGDQQRQGAVEVVEVVGLAGR